MSACHLLSVSCLPSELLSADGLNQDTGHSDTSVLPHCTTWLAENMIPPLPQIPSSPPCQGAVYHHVIVMWLVIKIAVYREETVSGSGV